MDEHIARSVEVLAGFVMHGRDLETTLHDLVDLAVRTTGADMAGLTIRDEHARPTTAVLTDRTVLTLDAAQYESDRGPCLDAARTHTVFVVHDTDTERRWPEFARVGADNGLRSSMSLPLVVGGDGVGAMNVYDSRVGYFDAAVVATGEVFTGQCSIAAQHWAVANEATTLAAALSSRATIEQAKGVIMATTGCSPDEAFTLLSEQSQNENRKLRDIAGEVVARQKR